MAILRSRSRPVDEMTIANPAVDQALQLWQERVAAAREEGRQAGLAEAADILAQAETQRQEAADAVAAASADAEQRIVAERAAMRDASGRAVAALHAVVADHEQVRAEVLRSAEREVVDLACALAARILRHQVASDPQWMEDLLAAALAQAPDKRRVLLRMHPGDAATVAELLPDCARRAGLEDAVDLRGDETLAPGACLIESGGTSIDAAPATTWGSLREQLLLAAPSDQWGRGYETTDDAAGAVVQTALDGSEDRPSQGPAEALDGAPGTDAAGDAQDDEESGPADEQTEPPA